MSDVQNNEVTRRRLLRDTALGAAAAGVGTLASRVAGAEKPLPKHQETSLPTGVLGRTKYRVTLISYGAILAAGKTGTRVTKRAIDIGINLLHTSMSYGKGKSVAAVGELFKADKTYRDRVLLGLKSFTPEKEAELDEMLVGLGTDHTDFLFPTLHDADPKTLELIQTSLDKYKKKGKIRHTGFVCHVDMNGVIEMVLQKAPEYFDAALIAMAMLPIPGNTSGNAADEKCQRFIKNLRALKGKGVGILSIKSGARSVVKQGSKLFQPHAKAILEAGADTVLTSIDTFEQVEMIRQLDLGRSTTTPAERRAAAEFRKSRAGACLMCGDCSRSCPQGLPVSDLMRIRMYHDEYGWHDHARAEFHALGSDLGRLPDACGDCSKCSAVCPVGLAGQRTVRQVVSLFA